MYIYILYNIYIYIYIHIIFIMYIYIYIYMSHLTATGCGHRDAGTWARQEFQDHHGGITSCSIIWYTSITCYTNMLY